MIFNCKECNKTFMSQRALNAHQVAHKDGNRYSVTRKTSPDTFTCINCGSTKKFSHQQFNKFCSNTCFNEHQKISSTKKIESGEVLSFHLMRKYLLETRGMCEECGITDTYNGKPITLQCDHINGDNDNHSLNNLRLLCPNCHSQTHTWCGRNKKETKRNTYLRQYKAGLAQR